MGRPSNITKEQVFAAADQLVSEGKKTTIREIRQILGTGALNTIMRHLEDWKLSQTPNWTPTIPKEIEAMGGSLLQELWTASHKHFDQQLLAIRAAFEAEKNDLREELAEALDLQFELEESVEQLTTDNTRLEYDLQILGAKSIGLQAQLDSANDTNEKMRSDIEKHITNERIAAERAIHAEILLEGIKNKKNPSDSSPEAGQDSSE